MNVITFLIIFHLYTPKLNSDLASGQNAFRNSYAKQLFIV